MIIKYVWENFFESILVLFYLYYSILVYSMLSILFYTMLFYLYYSILCYSTASYTNLVLVLELELLYTILYYTSLYDTIRYEICILKNI